MAYSDNNVIIGRYDSTGRQIYWSKGYKGKGVKVAVIDDFSTEHGHQMASIKDYIAPECELIKLDMRGDYYTLIDKIKEAISLKVNIISISRSVDFDVKPMHDAIVTCKNAGIICICSAGNDGDKYRDNVDIKKYPAYYEESISVMSIDNTFMFSSFASHNIQADVCSWGKNVLVKNSKGEEMLIEGTSPPTPIVAFSCALHWCKILSETGKHPTYDYMMNFIKTNVVDLNEIGKDNFTGYGFFTLDKSEFERVKMMILDLDNDGLSQRVNQIKELVKSGMTLESAEKQVNANYYIVGYEMINGVKVPVYGGKKQAY